MASYSEKGVIEVNSTRRKNQAKWIAGIIIILLLTALGSQSIYPQDLELKYPLGDIPLDPITYQRHLKFQAEAEMLEALPASYDARDEGIVTSPKNQGSCGSCWAFASVGAMESHVLKQFGFGPSNLSEQQQVSCNTSMAGCSGGSSSAIRYWQNKGPLYESCFPYTADDATPCIEDQCEQLDYRVVGWHTVPTNPDGFKSSLYEDGPSYWRYDVYSDFYNYWDQGDPGEVYVNSGGGLLGGHAVLLIGWDDAKQAYLCKNSWGGGGPNNDGTFWIAYSGHVRDLGFGMANFGLEAVGCSSDAECSDGLYCNGVETCVDSVCQAGTPPNCADDGLFCNGSEFCDEAGDACASTGDPCGAGTICDEDEDSCVPLNCGNGVCELGENCATCPDDCISGQGGSCGSCFKGECDGSCHPVKESPDCADCNPGYCCGDGVCEGGESADNCAVDCSSSACVPEKKVCDCDGECGKFESNETCPWDCPED
jgi:hypothetical protein